MIRTAHEEFPILILSNRGSESPEHPGVPWRGCDKRQILTKRAGDVSIAGGPTGPGLSPPLASLPSSVFSPLHSFQCYIFRLTLSLHLGSFRAGKKRPDISVAVPLRRLWARAARRVFFVSSTFKGFPPASWTISSLLSLLLSGVRPAGDVFLVCAGFVLRCRFHSSRRREREGTHFGVFPLTSPPASGRRGRSAWFANPPPGGARGTGEGSCVAGREELAKERKDLCGEKRKEWREGRGKQRGRSRRRRRRPVRKNRWERMENAARSWRAFLRLLCGGQFDPRMAAW